MAKDEFLVPAIFLALFFSLFVGLFIPVAGLITAAFAAEGIRRLRIRYTGRGYVDWDRCASRKVKKMREEENA